jgi:hypothetical protein
MKNKSTWYQQNTESETWFNDTRMEDAYIYASLTGYDGKWEYFIYKDYVPLGQDPLIERSPRWWATRKTAQQHAEKALERCAAKRAIIKMLQGS